MAEIKPFCAIRPRRDLAHLIVSRPVATYRKDILKAKLKENPYTFIHIIHPEFFEKGEQKTAPNSVERFNKVKLKFEEFCDHDYFLKDNQPHFYIYRQSNEMRSYVGVIAGASVDEYKKNKIKKHEATLTNREEIFTNYLEVVGVNAEPVLLFHKENKEVKNILNHHTKTRPEYEFTTTDKVKHELWLISKDELASIKDVYGNVGELYIADGHHRSASSARLADRLNKKGEKGDLHNYFLSYLISEEQLNILPFHRLCKTLNGLSKEAFLEQVKIHFDIKQIVKNSLPNELHQINCCIKGEWYQFRLKPEIVDQLKGSNQIDYEILTQYILTPILNIKDLKTDRNIRFSGGEVDLNKQEESIKKGDYEVGFFMYPVTVDQLKGVADRNDTMPPKSTWVEPKLRSGLTVYTIKNYG